MSENTPLDIVHTAMEAAAGDDTVRLRFYERLADAELFVLLSKDAIGDQIEPELFKVDGTSYVLVFDRETRLTRFAGRAVPYAALSGRAIVSMLAPSQLGMGVNLDVAPSSTLIPPEAVSWLAQTLDQAPDVIEAQIETFCAPKGLPETLITALDTKLALAAGLAHSAYLVGVTYKGGGNGHLLGFVDAVEHAQSALAQAANEALTFSGIEAGAIDVGFFAASDPVAAHLARAGLRFDLPQTKPVTAGTVTAPGRDPTKPPILR